MSNFSLGYVFVSQDLFIFSLTNHRLVWRLEMITGLVLEEESEYDRLNQQVNIFLLLKNSHNQQIVENSILCLPLVDLDALSQYGKYNTIDLTNVAIDDIEQNVNAIIDLSQRVPNVSVLLRGNCIRSWLFWQASLRSHVDAAIYIEDGKFIDNWTVEPVQYILVSNSSFELNSNEVQVMNNSQIVHRFDAPIIVSQLDQLTNVKWLRKQNGVLANILIDPLQPLTSFLPLDVYQRFEQDETKYHQYQLAMELAISDLPRKDLAILIVGPGTGKLIDMLFSIDCPNKIRVVTVEINPKCINGLHSRNSTDWNDKVEIIHADIRTCTLPFKPDIIISELLGSFGDNELCPEILARFTDKETIMIPLSYCSYLQPIYTSINLPSERPFLIYLTHYYPLDSHKFVWEFEHPSDLATDRSTKIQFQCQGLKLNGFYGFFQANLYGHINIHIDPRGDSHEYCKSWYPILFPVDEYQIKDNHTITLEICRKINHKVWYEWKFNQKIYNESGDSYSISL